MSRIVTGWMRLGPRYMPFADAATPDLPLKRLLRLSLFQCTVGMAMVLVIGTLNRVMIVELGVASWLVALMLALPLGVAPFRALIGHRSDTHRSVLGWRRVPYIWMGTMLQFGGLAIMPFALILLSGDSRAPHWVGQAGAGLAFLLVGAGMQTTQTAGLALATDLAAPETRPRVVALMYGMLLLGMVGGGLCFGLLLRHFSPLRLIQVVQGAALTTICVNLFALWKQEGRRGLVTLPPSQGFTESWQAFIARDRGRRFLWTVGLGTAAFNMQDVVLEPYGGMVLHLPVAATTALTALLAIGALTAFASGTRILKNGINPYRLMGASLLLGIAAFVAIIFAAPLDSPALFRTGVTLIGFSGGLFGVTTLVVAMNRDSAAANGLALGVWGAVQATSAGLAIAMGGALRDGVASLGESGALGSVLSGPSVGFSFVYHLEIALLFATLIALGPLVGLRARPPGSEPFKLA